MTAAIAVRSAPRGNHVSHGAVPVTVVGRNTLRNNPMSQIPLTPSPNTVQAARSVTLARIPVVAVGSTIARAIADQTQPEYAAKGMCWWVYPVAVPDVVTRSGGKMLPKIA